MMAEQALREHFVETFNDSLVSVNFRVSTGNSCFVVFHFFGHAPHELAARVNLQQLRLCQRTALVNRLQSLRKFRVCLLLLSFIFFVMACNVYSDGGVSFEMICQISGEEYSTAQGDRSDKELV